MREILEKALRKKGKVDYLEIRAERRETTTIHFQGRNLEKINCSQEWGGNIRALAKGGWSFITFNQFSDLEEKALPAIITSLTLPTILPFSILKPNCTLLEKAPLIIFPCPNPRT